MGLICVKGSERKIRKLEHLTSKIVEGNMNKWGLVTVFLMMSVGMAIAQEIFRSDSVVTLATGYNKAKRFAVGDINGDGWKDVAVAANDSINNVYVSWIRNLNNANFQKYNINTTLAGARVAELADLDQDGDLDVIAGSGISSGSDVLYWDNPGNPESQNWTQGLLADNAYVTYTLATGDFDDNPYPDVVVPSARYTNPPGEVFLELNNGNFSFTEQILDSNFQIANHVETADMDLDGYPDIIAASFSRQDLFPGSVSRIRIYYHSGNRSNVAFTMDEVADNLLGINQVSAGDINGDGWPDMVAISWLPTGQSALMIFYNQGNRSFSGPDTLLQGLNLGRSLSIADLDGDGDLDIAYALEGDQQIGWLRNLGSGSFDNHIIVNNLNFPYHLLAEDFDGDGDTDLLVSRHTDDLSGGILWVKNIGQQNLLVQSGNAAFQTAWGGDLEISVDSPTSQYVHVYKNEGAVPFSGQKPVDVDHLASRGYYTITTNAAFTSASVRFYYGNIPVWNQYDLGQENQLVMLVYDPGMKQWIIPSNQTVITSGHYIEVSGLAASELAPFTFWTIGTYVPDNSLPVELLSFEVRRMGDEVELGWTTASESDVLGFQMERIIDGKEKEMIASYRIYPELRSSGNSNEERRYRWRDSEIRFRPVEKEVEYILSVVEWDGRVEQQFSRKLMWNDGRLAEQIRITPNYPNPFNGSTIIDLEVPAGLVGEQLNFEVFNVSGQKVYARQETIQTNNVRLSWDIFSEDQKSIVSGHYFYQIRIGNHLFSGKMTVIK